MKKPSAIILLGAILLITPQLQSCNILPIFSQQQSQQQINPKLSPEELQQLASAITVKIIGGEAGGSGTIIRKVGSTYTVVTNQHVLQAVQGTSKYRIYAGKIVKNIRIQTSEGLDYPATIVKGENINFQDKDLGLLEFNADRTYDVGTFAKPDVALKPGEKVWAAGFPAESATPSSIVTTGEISLIPNQALEQGYQLGYTNPIQNGMSGGPIINGQGDLIGFNGRHGNPLFGDPFVYADGSKPTDAERQKMVGLSWGLPLSVLAQAAPEMMKEVEPAFTGLVKQVYDNAKAVTVRIEARDKKDPLLNPIPGSGVIIAKQKNTYYVVTASHVVQDSDQNYELIAPDGRRYRIDDDKIQQQLGQDVALVQFTSNEIYSVATLADYRVEDKGSWVFTAGWPKGKSQRNQQFEFTPGVRFSSENGSILAQNSASLTDGYEMVYTNVTQGGMSGGPVLDIHGRVVGIHGRAEGMGDLRLGWSLGIPANALLGALQVWGVERQWLQVETTPPPDLDVDKIAEVILAQLVTRKEPPKNDAPARDWINYGNQLWRQGIFDGAVEAFEKAIQLDRNSYAAWYAKGLALREADKYREAVHSFEQAIAIDNTHYEAWREKGKALYILKQYPEALTSIDQAIQRQDQDFVLYIFRGTILQLLERYEEAVEPYTKAIAIKPSIPAYAGRGTARVLSKDWSGAIADFDHAIQFNPQNAEFYYARGLAHKGSGDWLEVFADFDQVIQLNPQNAEAYTLRGTARANLEDKLGAIDDFTKAIQLNPQDAEAYVKRGSVRSVLKDWAKALDDFDQAIQLNPQNAQTYLGRGSTHYESGDVEGAITDFNTAIQLNPDDANFYYIRGVARYKFQDVPGAMADYNQAIKLNSQNAQAYLSRGIAHYNSRDKQDGIEDVQKAEQLFCQQGRPECQEARDILKQMQAGR